MKTRLLFTLALVLACSSLAHAEATPEATKWLDKLHDLVQTQPFSMDYVITVDGSQNGQTINAQIKGDLLQDGPKHAANNLEMKVGGEATGGQTMTVVSRQISDGTTLWAETNLVEMGMNQVAKIDLDELGALQAEASGLQMNQSSMYTDPISQIELLISAFDVDVARVEDGKVTLSLTPTAETAAQIEAEVEGGSKMVGTLVLREADAVPVSLDVDLGENLAVKLDFTDFELLSEDDVPEDAFTYTPEPGTQVMDLAPMLKAGM